jgi:hypothetical protein
MPALADRLKIPFIGCASHRLNLAVLKYIRDSHQEIVDKIAANMSILATKKNRGKLVRLDCNLGPKQLCPKWSSMYSMLKRYQEFIALGIFEEDWETMQLSDTEKEQLLEALKFLKECHIVSLQTQKVH